MEKLARILFLFLLAFSVICLETASLVPGGAETREASPHFPECLKIEGGQCWSKTSGLVCPHPVNATCQDERCYCCQVKPQETSKLKDSQLKYAEKQETSPHFSECLKTEGAQCWSKASALACPQRINATCQDERLYCCQVEQREIPKTKDLPLKLVETREISPHFPECLKIEGAQCWPNATTIACPQKINATCQDLRYYCCKLKPHETTKLIESPLKCRNIQNATCLFKYWTIYCPRIIKAACDKPEYYCCDMQRNTTRSSFSPNPESKFLAQCGSGNGGTCLFKASMIHCPKILNASCDVSHYCCDLRHNSVSTGGNDLVPSHRPTCQKAQGRCLSMASAFHCPKILKAKCEDSFHYCCDVGGNLMGNQLLGRLEAPPPPPPSPSPSPSPPLPPPRPICQRIRGTCLANASNIHCPRKLQAKCRDNHHYCCDLRPSCEQVQGSCLPNSSAIHCPNNLKARCSDNHHYCCDLRPSCEQVHGSCLPNSSAIHCPNHLKARCSDNNHYCCDQRPVSSCKEVFGTCLPNASAIHCPKYLQGTCEDSHQYCCDLRPTCKELYGTCLPNASAIHCPKYVQGTCDESHHYCCDLRPTTGTCKEAYGTCLPNASAIHCPKHIQGTCEDSHLYCCDLRRPCNQVHGTCLHNASDIHCPVKLDATCQDNYHYCCDLGVHTKENQEMSFPTCHQTQGSCLPNNSHIYCPLKLNATCEDNRDYCCDLGGRTGTTEKQLLYLPTCEEVQGVCFKNNATIYCPVKVNATCKDSDSYCCDLELEGGGTRTSQLACEKIQGTCLSIKSDILCQKKMNGKCEDDNRYCCDLNDQPNSELFFKASNVQPKCDEENGGTCLLRASRIFCPEKLRGDCGDPEMYCCNLHGFQREATDVDHMSVNGVDIIALEAAVNVCEDTGKGTCLSVHSRIYCPEKIWSSCGDPDLYCCKLH